MKTFGITLGTIAIAVVLVATGAWLGSNWTQDRWGDGPIWASTMHNSAGASVQQNMMGEYGLDHDDGIEMPCDQGWQGRGDGMMAGGTLSCEEAYVQPGGELASLQEAQEVVEAYVGRSGYEGLHVSEIMEFERNYYAIVAEEESGMGAMELLIDKDSGAIGPEPGPNMMWNTEYGMHVGQGMMGRGSMMGGYDAADETTLSPEEAQDAGQAWLDENFPGRSAGEPDPFYGYYTLHFLNDGEIEGMLSVHGSSGDVWYHSWHGDFIDMAGGHD